MTVLNEFELMSIGIQRGILDYKIYPLWCRTATVHYWNHGHPFVAAIRNRIGNDALFHEFEEMVKWMKDTKMPKRTWWWGMFF